MTVSWLIAVSTSRPGEKKFTLWTGPEQTADTAVHVHHGRRYDRWGWWCDSCKNFTGRPWMGCEHIVAAWRFDQQRRKKGAGDTAGNTGQAGTTQAVRAGTGAGRE